MDNASGGLLSVGLILSQAPSNGMTALMKSFNVAYDVEDSRNFVVAKLLSVVFISHDYYLPIAMILLALANKLVHYYLDL